MHIHRKSPITPICEKPVSIAFADRLSIFWGSFRLPGSAASSAIGLPLRVERIIRSFPALAYASGLRSSLLRPSGIPRLQELKRQVDVAFVTGFVPDRRIEPSPTFRMPRSLSVSLRQGDIVGEPSKHGFFFTRNSGTFMKDTQGPTQYRYSPFVADPLQGMAFSASKGTVKDA